MNDYPPADQDFGELREPISTIPTDVIDIETGDDSTDETPEAIERLTRNTKAEIRELQRLMLNVARHDEMGSARASAARAYRDLEILRMAKNGKPLMLNVTGKADAKPPRNSAPLTIVDIEEPDRKSA